MSERITGRPMDMASSAAFENDSTAIDGSTNTSMRGQHRPHVFDCADEMHAIGDLQLRRAPLELLAQRAVAGDHQVRIDARHAQAAQRRQQHFLVLLRRGTCPPCRAAATPA